MSKTRSMRRSARKATESRASAREEMTAVPFPERKISQTILDFGGELIDNPSKEATFQAVERAVKLVITVWNTCAMTHEVWGHPDGVESLRSSFAGPDVDPLWGTVVDGLIERYNEHFAGDPRVVTDWEIHEGEAGRLQLSCSATVPKAFADKR